jgi:DNA polymerase-1
VPVLVGVERAGVRIERPLWRRNRNASRGPHRAQRTDLPARRRAVQHRITAAALRILFDKLQLPALQAQREDATRVDGADVLEELALTHDLPRLILEWRELMKLKGTYIDALPQLVNPRPGACTPASTRRWRPPDA